MLPLFTKVVEGETYTMVLQVTSTCDDKDVEIGFPGGWFVSKAPPSAKGAVITVTDKWREGDMGLNGYNLRLESITECPGKSLTIHSVQFVKGEENCFEGGM